MADPLSELLDSEEFRRFLGHQGTPADEVEVRRLADQAGLAPADLDRLRMVVEKGERWRVVARKTGLDAELVWSRSVSRASPLVWTRRPTAASRLPRRGARAWWIGIAAVLCLVASGAFAWLSFGSARARTPPPRTLATRAGQRIQYRLPDGSQVLLAPESELRFATWSPAGPRDVQLDGEAYFDVTHDETRPFRVHITGALIEDLGTEFVVRAYPRDSAPYVAVRSGLVAVRAPAAPVSAGLTLKPGEVARVGANGMAVKVSADTSVFLGWTAGQLVFRDAPLADVVRQLQRWYGVEVSITDSVLLATQVTLAITDRSTPAEAIAYAAAVANARVDRRGAAFFLRGR